MSPFKRGVFPHTISPEYGKHTKGLVCINSGLCIKRELYDYIGKYNESQFLDMLDYWLFDELSKHGLDNVLFVKGSIVQDFSANKHSSYSEEMNRYRIFKKDFSAYCAVEKKSLLFRGLILIKRRLNIIRHQIIG